MTEHELILSRQEKSGTVKELPNVTDMNNLKIKYHSMSKNVFWVIFKTYDPYES